MVPIIAKPLEVGLKLCGIWPFGKYRLIGPSILLAAFVIIVPGQCWEVTYLMEDPLVLMDTMSDIIAEILVYVKLIIMWSNKRFFLHFNLYEKIAKKKFVLEPGVTTKIFFNVL